MNTRKLATTLGVAIAGLALGATQGLASPHTTVDSSTLSAKAGCGGKGGCGVKGGCGGKKDAKKKDAKKDTKKDAKKDAKKKDAKK